MSSFMIKQDATYAYARCMVLLCIAVQQLFNDRILGHYFETCY